MSLTFRGRRDFLKLSAAATGAAAVTACVGPSAPVEVEERLGQFRVGKLEGGTLGSPVPTSFNEAPELADAVREGRLPPVAERVGQDPLVLKPVHETGKYGGTIRRVFNGTGDFQNANRFASGPDGLLYWDYEWKNLVPWVARGFERSADGRTLTVQLRRGMRWSDGTPFTADDILFWYEDIYSYAPLGTPRDLSMQINGKDVRVVRVDASTVRFESPDPNPLLADLLAGGQFLRGMADGGRSRGGAYAPKHYLSRFHPKYTPQAEVDRLSSEARAANWQAHFTSRLDWTLNADLPVLTPWKVRKGNELNSQNWVFDRNPYYFAVDAAGNQLPYISSLQHTLGENPEVINLRAVAGEFDFQERHLQMTNLPLLIENQERSGYKIYLDPGQTNDYGLRVNLAYEADAEIGRLLQTADFRRALSLGIDRDQINEGFFLGAAVPGAYGPPKTNKYYPGDEYAAKWATFDVAQANRLLDGLGYTAKDADGYRLRKDNGQRLRLIYTVSVGRFADVVGIGEMIKRQWANIGVDLTVEVVSSTLSITRAQANTTQLSGQSVGSDDLFINPSLAFPFLSTGIQSQLGVPAAQWFQTGGRQGKEPFPELKELMALWTRGYGAPEEERIRIGKEWWAKAIDECLQIGVIGQTIADYGIHYAKTNMGNIPARVINAGTFRTILNAWPTTFFYR